jgi:hypothetical protein
MAFRKIWSKHDEGGTELYSALACYQEDRLSWCSRVNRKMELHRARSSDGVRWTGVAWEIVMSCLACRLALLASSVALDFFHARTSQYFILLLQDPLYEPRNPHRDALLGGTSIWRWRSRRRGDVPGMCVICQSLQLGQAHGVNVHPDPVGRGGVIWPRNLMIQLVVEFGTRLCVLWICIMKSEELH